MRAVKTLQISYQPTEEVLELLGTFREMVNLCIDIGLERKITSRFKLSNAVYHKLNEYGLHTWYNLSAIEVASTILKNYRKALKKGQNATKPYARKLMAKLNCSEAYKVVEDELRIPIQGRQYFFMPIHKRAKEFLSDATLKLGSVTLTARTVSVAFSKTIEVAEPRGYVAFDINEKTVDGITSEGKVLRYDLTQVYETNSSLFERSQRFHSKRAGDRRVQKKVLSKWSKRRNNQVEAVLHKVSKEIVDEAKKNGFGIVVEDLKGIKKTVNKKTWRINRVNGKAQRISESSKRLKRRLNVASMRKLERFVKYKALWEGIKVLEVNARGTSSRCSICRSKLEYLNVQSARCPRCGPIDRQLNAAVNLLKTQDEGVRFTPNSLSNVAVKRNEGPMNSNPQSRRKEVAYATEP